MKTEKTNQPEIKWDNQFFQFIADTITGDLTYMDGTYYCYDHNLKAEPFITNTELKFKVKGIVRDMKYFRCQDTDFINGDNFELENGGAEC